MAAWPTSLPRPLLSGYSVEPTQAFIRTDMEAGPARQRKRFTAVPNEVVASWKFKPAEMETFLDFYAVDINQGTDYFTCELDIGNGFQTYNVRFTAAPKRQALPGMNWNVSGRLEVRVD